MSYRENDRTAQLEREKSEMREHLVAAKAKLAKLEQSKRGRVRFREHGRTADWTFTAHIMLWVFAFFFGTGAILSGHDNVAIVGVTLSISLSLYVFVRSLPRGDEP